MAENFRKLLDQQNAILAKKANKPTSAISPAAYALCDMMGHAFERYEQHVTDCLQTANKAYSRANELAKRLDTLESRLVELEGPR